MAVKKEHAAVPAAPKPQIPWWKTKRTRIVAIIAGGAVAFGFLIWLVFFMPFISTNDARVDASIIRVANAGANGQITGVYVREGDPVTNGMLLAELDHRTAEAQLLRAEARAEFTAAELRRTESLAAQQGTSRQQLDRSRSEADMAESDLRLAQIALDRTYLRSPVNGVVIQKLAVEGNILEVNQAAVTVVDIDHAWVSANISEMRVHSVHKGAKVRIHIDEGGTITGRVSDVRKATASTFALVPSDSASGNYIKVVQRIPVKIELDPHPGKILRVGQSVEIKISVF
jgi:RND family efflux transporter MFP subunit